MDTNFAFNELRTWRKIDTAGYEISINQSGKGYSVKKSGKQITLTYERKNDLMRAYNTALGLIKRGVEEATCVHERKFDDVIAMPDLARNAVLNVPTLKQYLCRLAGLGYTEVWLYLEDEFEVPGESFFGLQRGRYSQAELHELAIYADKMGIELVPAIQTLAHLKRVLQYEHYRQIGDLNDTLYVGKEATKDFVKKELEAATAQFLTKKIHIGMDEAHNLGLGQYFFDHGSVDQTQLMLKHAKMVLELCREMGLKPIMWSDMWFELASTRHEMYDRQADVASLHVDPEIGQIYWDYYNIHEDHYTPMMQKHFELSPNVYFAGGIWTWARFAPNQSKMLASIKAGLSAAKKTGIKKVAATAWMDDGGEAPYWSSLLGWQVFSDYQYLDEPTETDFENNFDLLQDENYQAYMLLGNFDNTKDQVNDVDEKPSKLVLYEDLLQPRYYQNLKDFDFGKYYDQLANKLEQYREHPLFNYYYDLAKALSVKAKLMVALTSGNTATDLLDEWQDAIALVARERLELWFKENKPNGSEVMDIRFGGLIQRANTVRSLLAKGEYQPDLPAVEMDKHINGDFGNSQYYQIVTPSDISW